MRIPLFAYDANAAVDSPRTYISREEVLELLSRGEVSILINTKGKEWAVQFNPVLEHTLASQLAAFLATSPNLGSSETAEDLLDLFKSSSESSTASISDGEMRANAGVADEPMEIIRARTKVKAWPIVGDDLAVRVGCRA
jgi:hypothetical protein